MSNGARHPTVVLVWIDEPLPVGETDFVGERVVTELHTEIHLCVLDDFTHMPVQALAESIGCKAILDTNFLTHGDPAIHLERLVRLDVVVLGSTKGNCRDCRRCNRCTAYRSNAGGDIGSS